MEPSVNVGKDNTLLFHVYQRWESHITYDVGNTQYSSASTVDFDFRLVGGLRFSPVRLCWALWCLLADFFELSLHFYYIFFFLLPSSQEAFLPENRKSHCVALTTNKRESLADETLLEMLK